MIARDNPVLIAGAGIAGLTLGLSLHALAIPFRIFEAVTDPRPLGVGINLQPMATRELFELGLEDVLEQVGLSTGEVAYFNRFGQEVWCEKRGLAAGYRWPQYSLHRGRLQMALLAVLRARAGSDCVVTGRRVTGWRAAPGGGVEITLEDRGGGPAQSARGALLIGADGINSAIRARLYPEEGPARWGGTMMWRGITRGARIRGGRSMVMIGEKHIKFVAYPIEDIPEGSLINWIADLAMPPGYDWLAQDWNRPGRRADFAPRFAGWRFGWIDVPAIIEAAEGIWEFPMVDRDPLPRWSFGPVTLIGDAAHAMYPIGSNGASQGIIDARILARILRDRGLEAGALAAYDAERREAVNRVVLANRGDGPDKVLDIVAARAPQGFDDIEAVMPLAERRALAEGYKALAGMGIDEVNGRPSILGAEAKRGEMRG